MTSLRATNFASLSAFFLSGVAALVYEVCWTRALALVLGNTVYAVSTMLATFMLGLALGALVGGKLCSRQTNLLRAFAFCELLTGILGLVSIPLIYQIPPLYLTLYRSFHLSSGVFYILQFFLCSAIMLPPTILMGATFPLVSRSIISSLEDAGRKVADAYSVNTIGAVMGSILVGFILIPMLGVKGATTVAAGLNVVAGTIVLVNGRFRAGGTLLCALPLYSLSLLWLGVAQERTELVGFYGMGQFLENRLPYQAIAAIERADLKKIFDRDYAEGRLRAYRDRDGSLILQIAGKREGTGRADMANTILLSYLPAASHTAPVSGLVIGLGSGVTLKAAKEALPATDLVEIHPGVLQVVKAFGPPGVLEGVRVNRGDARQFLMTTDRKFDVITSEPSYPTDSAVGSLFTSDFYRMASAHLNRGGVYCQWLPYYFLTNDNITMMLRTLTATFPYLYLWRVNESFDLIAVGSLEPFRVSADEVKKRVESLNGGRYKLDYQLSKTPEQIREIVSASPGPINTDDRPLLEFATVGNILLGDLRLIEH